MLIGALFASRHFGREIAAHDIQTKRCDVYGQGKGYRERVMLIYDGLHYDALALAGKILGVRQLLMSADHRHGIINLQAYTNAPVILQSQNLCQYGVIWHVYNVSRIYMIFYYGIIHIAALMLNSLCDNGVSWAMLCSLVLEHLQFCLLLQFVSPFKACLYRQTEHRCTDTQSK